MLLITGATGFLGKQLLKRHILNDPTSSIAVLIRGENIENRKTELLTSVFGPKASHYADRVIQIAGDITLDNFGLGQSEFNKLGSSISSIIHCAATTVLNLPLNSSRLINVMGTEQVIKLAKVATTMNKQNFRLHHISTAYVAGDTQRIVTPDEIGNSFRNTYEQTKAEAESLIRSQSENINPIIYRPSVIVGNSLTGETSAFNVLYTPARFIIKGFIHALPMCPDTPLDVVPVDYVADCVAALNNPSTPVNSSYHICAGVGRETTPFEIMDWLIKTFNKYRKQGISKLSIPPWLTPEVISLISASISVACNSVKNLERLFCKRVEILRQVIPFIPYMTHNPRFETSATYNILRGVVAPAPLFEHYAEKVFKYCIDTNWGKNSWLTSEHRLNLQPI